MMRHVYLVYAALCAMFMGVSAWAEQPIDYRPPPQGLVITYDDGSIYTFGATTDRSTQLTVTVEDECCSCEHVLREVFFYTAEQTSEGRYTYGYQFLNDASIWPLDSSKAVHAKYLYGLDGFPDGSGELTATAGPPETVKTPAGEFAVRRVKIIYEARAWLDDDVTRTVVCLYAPAIGYCIGFSITEDGETTTKLATKIVQPPDQRR